VTIGCTRSISTSADRLRAANVARVAEFDAARRLAAAGT
jgi:hypothetical protein